MQWENKLPRYVGNFHPNCDYHHGQVPPIPGVQCFQISRANRRKTEDDDRTGYTYKHAPDIVYFHGKLYVQYLCNPVDEHDGAGMSILASSANGKNWADFHVSFPPYRIPACVIQDYKGQVHSFDGTTYAFMHQRMSFYYASNGCMLVCGFYGWSPDKTIPNWDNYGIGRVVRELYADGSLSPIYFILPCTQAGWKKEHYLYPYYTESPDEDFVAACKELLSNRLYVQQWAEENGDREDLITIKHPKDGTYQAFCWYHIDESTVIGLWKHSIVSRSDDGGKTWLEPVRSPSLVMSGQKVWGCKTSDGKFAMVYNPTLETQHRYPLCVTVSEDGLAFDRMGLVHGEVPPLRYKGFWKDLGPQYVRGISEGNPMPEDGNLWVTYSVNKEDIWIAKIPVPIYRKRDETLEEEFSNLDVLNRWNLYKPKWANISCSMGIADRLCLTIENREPLDYVRVERVFEPRIMGVISFRLSIVRKPQKELNIEVCNEKEQTAIRLIFRDNGKLYTRTVAELEVMNYEIGSVYDIDLIINCSSFSFFICVNDNFITENGLPKRWPFMMVVNEFSRFFVRTGPRRMFPTLEQSPDNMPNEFSEKALEN